MPAPVAIVTGASRGIGFATVEALEHRGFKVWGLARTQGQLTRFEYLPCDVTDPDQVSAAFGRAFYLDGPPTILVNCAGIAVPASLQAAEWFSWRQQFDVNVGGAFLAIREFLTFAYGGGLIVNVASTSAHRPSPGWAAYGASKAALVHLGQSVLAEANETFDVLTISPGRTATALRRALAPDEDQSTIQQPEAVARAISHGVKRWLGAGCRAHRGAVWTVTDGRIEEPD